MLLVVEPYERKVIRKIYVRMEHLPQVRMNNEVKRIFDSPSITAEIRSKGIGWIRHTQSMDNKIAIKQTLSGKLERKRHYDKSRSKWISVQQDIKTIGIKNS